MAPRRPAAPPPKPLDFPPEKTHRALKQQLAALEKLRGRNFHEAEHDEQEWKNLTLNILTHGFGEGSENIAQFYSAKLAGERHGRRMSAGLLQHQLREAHKLLSVSCSGVALLNLN